MNSVAAKIVIPAQPSVMLEINKLLNSSNAGINEIAGVISKDIGLSASVLKTVNTPLFSRGRKIDSIKQAVNALGISNIKSVVLNASLKAQFSKVDPKFMYVFWRHVELNAIACELIAKKFCRELSDNAYIAGLFHDCAVPLLMQKYPDYFELFKRSMQAGDCNILVEEQKRYATNHCVIGSVFCEAWFLPEIVSSGIRHHHVCLDESAKCCGEIPENILIEKMTAILVVSDKIVQNFDLLERNSNFSLDEWMEKYEKHVELLGIHKEDMLDIQEDFLDKAFV